MNITRAVTAASLLAGAALAVTACGPTVAKTPATAPSTFGPAATSAPASPGQAGSGPLGTSYTVTTTDDSGNAVAYKVILGRVDQHAGLTAYETLDKPGDHMAAARFTITGVTGQESDDANNDATAVGTDTTEYQPSFTSVTDGGNFSSGTFSVSPGETVSGWVAFELAPGQSVASVQWSPSSGFSGSHATWTLG
jgi:hypothetical protein